MRRAFPREAFAETEVALRRTQPAVDEAGKAARPSRPRSARWSAQEVRRRSWRHHEVGRRPIRPV